MTTRTVTTPMRRHSRGVYRVAWTVATAAIYAVGCYVAWVSIPFLALAGLFATAVLLGVCYALLWSAFRPLPSATVRHAAAWTAAVVVAATGLIKVGSGAAVLLLPLAHLCAPGTVRLVLRMFHRKAGAAGSPPDEAPPVLVDPLPDLDDLDWQALDDELAQRFAVPDHLEDRDLCLAWQSSYLALAAAKSVESRLRLVQLRQLYLDDLERRNEQAVRAWLGSGARAAGAPTRFLSS